MKKHIKTSSAIAGDGFKGSLDFPFQTFCKKQKLFGKIFLKF